MATNFRDYFDANHLDGNLGRTGRDGGSFKPDDRSELSKGFLSGVEETKGLVFGALPAAVKSMFGADDLSVAESYSYYQDRVREAQAQYRGESTEYDDVKDLDTFVDFSLYHIGNMIPSLVGGGLAGVAVKTGVKKGLKSFAKKNADGAFKNARNKTDQLFFKEARDKAATAARNLGRQDVKTLRRLEEDYTRIALNRGADLGEGRLMRLTSKALTPQGSMATGFGLFSVGSAFGETFAKVIESEGVEAPWYALAAGIGSGLLDAVAPLKAIKKIMPEDIASKVQMDIVEKISAPESVKRGMRGAKEALSIAGTEGVTEFMQEVIQNAAVSAVYAEGGDDALNDFYTAMTDEMSIAAYKTAALAGLVGSSPIASAAGYKSRNVIPSKKAVSKKDISGEIGSDREILDNLGGAERLEDPDKIEAMKLEDDPDANRMLSQDELAGRFPSLLENPDTFERRQIEDDPDANRMLSQDELAGRFPPLPEDADVDRQGTDPTNEGLLEENLKKQIEVGIQARREIKPIAEQYLPPEQFDKTKYPLISELVGKEVQYDSVKGTLVLDDRGYVVQGKDEEVVLGPEDDRLAFEVGVIERFDPFQEDGVESNQAADPGGEDQVGENRSDGLMLDDQVAQSVSLDDLPQLVRQKALTEALANDTGFPESITPDQAIDLVSLLPESQRSGALRGVEQALGRFNLVDDASIKVDSPLIDLTYTPTMVFDDNETSSFSSLISDDLNSDSDYVDSENNFMPTAAEAFSNESAGRRTLSLAISDIIFKGRMNPDLAIVGHGVHILEGSKYDGTNGTYNVLDDRVAISRILIEQAETDAGAANDLRTGLSHEIGHRSDLNRGITDNNPGFSFKVNSISPSGKDVEFGILLSELYINYSNETRLGEVLSYPFGELNERIDRLTPSEIENGGVEKILKTVRKEAYAQAFSVFFSDKKLLRRNAPKTFQLIDELNKNPAEGYDATKDRLKIRGTESQVVQGEVQPQRIAGSVEVQDAQGDRRDSGDGIEARQARTDVGEPAQEPVGDGERRLLQVDDVGKPSVRKLGKPDPGNSQVHRVSFDDGTYFDIERLQSMSGSWEWYFSYPGLITYGLGKIGELPTELKVGGIGRTLQDTADNLTSWKQDGTLIFTPRATNAEPSSNLKDNLNKFLEGRDENKSPPQNPSPRTNRAEDLQKYISKFVERGMSAEDAEAKAILQVQRDEYRISLIDEGMDAKEAIAQSKLEYPDLTPPPTSNVRSSGDTELYMPSLRMSDLEDEKLAKSAGDVGTIERVSRFLKSMTDPDVRDEKLGDLRQRVVQGVFDDVNRIGYLEKKMNEGELLDGSQSAYKAALWAKNIDTVMQAAFVGGPIEYKGGSFRMVEGAKGFYEIFAGYDKSEIRQWELWASANRADRLIKEGREKLFTQDEINEIKAEAKAQGNEQKFEQTLQDWIAFNRKILDLGEQTGVIDPESRKRWDKDDYVPFYRFEDEQDVNDGDSDIPKASRGIANQKLNVRQLVGGEGKINPVEAMQSLVTQIVSKSLKNEAMRRTVNILDGTDALMEVADTKGNNDLSRDKDSEIVKVSVGGKPKLYLVRDPMLLRSVKGLGAEAMDSISSVFSVPKQVLTRGVTISPAFMLSNAIRDVAAATIQFPNSSGFIEGFKEAMAYASRGIKSELPGGEVNQEDRTDLLQLMASGGLAIGDFYGTGKVKNIRKDLNRINSSKSTLNTQDKLDSFYDNYLDIGADKAKDTWSKWNRVGMAFEQASRINIYRNALENGETHAEAISQAADVLNFSKSGSWPIVRWMVQSMPFFNARLQGLNVMGRSIRDNREHVLKKGGQLAAASIALYMINSENEEYEQLPDYDKDLYFHIFTNDEHFRIPKPFELGFVFGTLPERMATYWREDKDMSYFVDTFSDGLTQALSFDLLPQLMRPAVNAYSNKDPFRERPIVSGALESAPPAEQYTLFTNDTAKWVAQNMPDAAPEMLRSPQKMEYLLRGYFSSFNWMASVLLDPLLRDYSEAGQKPAKTLSQQPLIGRFYRTEIESSKYASQFYELRGHLNQMQRSYNKLVDLGKTEKARAYAKDNGGFEAARKGIASYYKIIKAINNKRDLIYKDKSLSAEQKRDRIQPLYVERNRIFKEAFKKYEDIL